MNRNRVAGVVIVGVIAILAIVLTAQARKPAAAGPATGSAAGATGATLQGTTLRGGSFDLVTTRGKPVVVNFFGSWCQWCVKETPDLVAFAKAHPEVAFVGVDVQDKTSDALAFVQQYGVTYPVVVDSSGSLSGAWGVNGFPTTVFLDASGVEKDRIIGASDTAAFQASLAKAQ